MNENDLRVIKTKKALHQALLLLLKTNSLESISVSSLCRTAKVNRGTFYLHYRDVGALFDDHLSHLLQDLENSFFEPYRLVEHLVPSHLDPSTIRIFHHVKEYQSFYEIVFDKNSSLSYYYALYNKLKNLLKESISYYSLDEKNRDMLLAYQTNAIMGVLIEWFERGFQESPQYMNKQFLSVINMKFKDE